MRRVEVRGEFDGSWRITDYAVAKHAVRFRQNIPVAMCSFIGSTITSIITLKAKPPSFIVHLVEEDALEIFQSAILFSDLYIGKSIEDTCSLKALT